MDRWTQGILFSINFIKKRISSQTILILDLVRRNKNKKFPLLCMGFIFWSPKMKKDYLKEGKI